MCLEAGSGITVLAYVDASFAFHEDYKSHTGGVISLCKGPLFVKSAKQKCCLDFATVVGNSSPLIEFIVTV